MTDTSPESPPAPTVGQPPQALAAATGSLAQNTATREGPAPERGERVMTPEAATAPPPPHGMLRRSRAMHVPEKGGPDAR
jgi:hypothetical protein